jgi:transposase InsO family protein
MPPYWARQRFQVLSAISRWRTTSAYTEVLADEKGATAAGFWIRAEAWFRARGVVVERVMTDNGFCYRGELFNQALADTAIRHLYTRPYRPQTNGKVERFNRTMLVEWAYVGPYRCEAERTRALARWMHRYNHHGCTPPSAVHRCHVSPTSLASTSSRPRCGG